MIRRYLITGSIGGVTATAEASTYQGLSRAIEMANLDKIDKVEEWSPMANAWVLVSRRVVYTALITLFIKSRVSMVLLFLLSR
jgi:hypothetical protein